MTFRKEFPDYDAATLPAIPDSWTDQSWHNDTCPSFCTGNGVVVFVDYGDTAKREFSDGVRFTVHTDPEMTNSNDVLLETDDWAAVLTFVAGFSDVHHVLSRCDGACLYWQMPNAERAKAALDAGTVTQDGDLLVHPDAVMVQQGMAYAMRKHGQ